MFAVIKFRTDILATIKESKSLLSLTAEPLLNRKKMAGNSNSQIGKSCFLVIIT